MHRFYYYFIALLLLGVALILPSAGSSSAHVAVGSSWLKTQPPQFKLVQSDIPAAQVPVSRARECTPNTKFVAIPKRLIPYQAESSLNVCAVQTAFGQQDNGSNLIQLNDTLLSGPVKTSDGITLVTGSIPSSKHMLYSSGGIDGSHLYLVKNFVDNMNIVTQPNGSVYYQLKPGVNGTGIKDAAGNMISFYGTHYSANGKWLIGEVPHKGMTRVNIETGETLVFGPAYNHQNGIRPSFTAAISSDGRYAITAEHRYDILRLYDLTTCIPNPDQTKTANCQSRNLFPEARSQINNFTLVQHAQFSTNYTIRLHVQYDTGQYGLFTLTASGEKESLLDYLALGDSFASGEGAFSYKPETDVRNPFNKCHLSLVSYPYLIAARTNLNAAQSVACSGARIKDIHHPDERIYNSNAKQSFSKEDDSFTPDIYSKFLVGYRLQNNFVQQTKPTRATLSISGNDIGFGNIILACIKPGTCYTDTQDRLNLVHTINSKFNDIVHTYQKTKDSAGTGAHIYTLGYPLLTDPEGNCALNVRLDKQELVFANQVVRYLNSVIKRAAEKAGVFYIDIENTLTGHRLCEAVSSNSAVHGISAGDDKTVSVPLKLVDHNLDIYLTGRESYHPNQLGHRLLADAILGATNNFALKNPLPLLGTLNPNETQPEANAILPAIPPNSVPKRIMYDDKFINNVLLSGKPNQIQVTDLQPGTDATIWLRTDSKLNLGTFRSSSSGTLTTDVAIPADVKPGFYPIEIHAKNSVGEDIIIQKTVYIAASAQDIDGDGTINDQEKCLAVEPANADIDKDATDDACDGIISEPPTTSTPLQTEQNTNSVSGPGSGTISINTVSTNTPVLAVAKPAAPEPQPQTVNNFETISPPFQVLGTNSLPPTESAAAIADTDQPVSSRVIPLWLLVVLISLMLSLLFMVFKQWRKRQ